MISTRLLFECLLVGVGGFLGAILRFIVVGQAQEWFGARFPWGTLAVNLAGCLIIGGFMAWFERHPEGGLPIRLFLSVGILGSLTTFSAFGYETMALFRDDEVALALLNMMANLLLGFGAVLAGRFLVVAILP